MRVMKRALLVVAAFSLVSVACAVDPFSNVSGRGGVAAEAGATEAGAPDAAGSPSAAGSGAGGSGGKLTTGRGGKPAGGASTGGAGGGAAVGTGGSETTAGSAGEPETGGTGAAGSSGSGGAGAGSGGTGVAGGDAGTGSGGSAAGMPGTGGTGGTGTVIPSCSSSEAFARAAAPSGPLTIAAWSGSFAADNVCWKQEKARCTFHVDSWGPSPADATRYRLFLSQVTCDKLVRYGSGSADSCQIAGECDAFNGGGSSMIAIDFALTPDASGDYVASGMENKGAILGGSNCEFSSSPGPDMLATGAEELLSSMTFSCGG